MKVVVADMDSEAGSELQARLVALGHEASLVSNKRDTLAAIQPSTKVVLISTSRLGYSLCNLLRKKSLIGRPRLLMYGPSQQRRAMEQHARLDSRADAYLTLPVTESELHEAVRNVSAIPERAESKASGVQVVLAGIWGAGLLAVMTSAVLASIDRVLHKAGWESTIRGLSAAGVGAYLLSEGGTWIRRGSLPNWRKVAVAVAGIYLAARAAGWLLG